MAGESDVDDAPYPEGRQARSLTSTIRDQKLRATNAALAASRARYVDLYDFAPVAYLRLDSRTRIVQANMTAATLFGIERGRLIGRPLSGLVAPLSRPALLEHVRACFGERIRVSTQIAILGRGSGNVAVQLTSTPVQGDDGGVVACKSTLTDVSELKRAEEMLRFLAQSGAKLSSSFDYERTVAEVMQQAVPILGDVAIADLFDLSGELRRIQVAIADPKRRRLARAARRVSPPRGRGTPVDQVVLSREALVLTDCNAGTLRDGSGGLVHEAFVRACLPRAVMYVPIISHDTVVGILTFLATDSSQPFREQEVGSATDLASRIAMAVENARLYDEATRAVRTREQVLSFVSHDLKNPLMGILLSTELLLNRPLADERRRGWKQLDRIRRGVQQMRHMVEDLLDASSIDSGHLSMVMTVLPVHEILDEALELLEPIAQDKDIRLQSDLAEPALELRCDRHRLTQVLYNLIGNALKFAARSGQVVIAAARSGADLLFTVEDDGPGVSAELVPRLFQRYVQGEGTARLGRGLGLFISRGIVEAHGGRIWADANPGRGARFQFTIPLAGRAVALAETAGTESFQVQGWSADGADPTSMPGALMSDRKSWKGDAVAEAPPGESEAAADRVAGREASPHPRESPPPNPGRYQPRKLSPEDAREIEEEKRQAAAEQHEEDRESGNGTAPKNM